MEKRKCLYNVYNVYLHNHFVMTSFSAVWQMEGRARCFAPSLLCAIVKSTKYSFDAEANEIYEEKTHWPYYLPVQTMLESWIEDVTLWPPVEIADIVLKFLESTLGRN